MFVEPRTEIASRLAAETAAPYAVGAASPVAGLLDRVSALADRRDREMGELVRCLVTASETDDLAELTGGMSLQVWLEHGPTDADNLQPLGRRWHNHKTTRAWTVHRARDGTTTWRHRRHDWRITLAPPRRDLTDVPDPGPPRLGPPGDGR